MAKSIKPIFVGEIMIPDRFTPGFLKTHEYTSYLVAPTLDNTNEHLDTLLKSFHSIRNNQVFKAIRKGQPIVALEFYADHTESFYLYTVPYTHRTLMREKIQAAFRGGGVREYDTTRLFPFNVFSSQEILLAKMELSKPAFFPLSMEKTANVAKDILHVAEEIRDKEMMFLQILLEPADDGWQGELEHAYESYLMGNELVISGLLKNGGKMLDQSITRFAKRFGKEGKIDVRHSRDHRKIKDVSQKIRQQGFHVAIRIAVSAPSYDRRNDIVEGIAGAIKASDHHNSWQVVPVIRRQSLLEGIKNRKMPVLGTPNLLCNDEVKSLISFPTKEMDAKKLERMRPDEEKVDVRVTEKIIPIGRSIQFKESGNLIGFSIANPDTACKARLWIAPPGSGKSTAAKLFKCGAMNVGHGGSIFDVADGRLYYEAIETTPPEQRNKLIPVNFADEKYPYIFNFSSLGSDADMVGTMFAEFFEVFFKTASNHRMNSFLMKSAMTVFQHPDSTFLELILLMRDEDFRKNFLPTIRSKNPDLFLWWKTEFPKLVKSDSNAAEILQPIMYRLDQLQYNKRLAPIFCGRGGGLAIEKWMNDGCWILYNLSNGVFLETDQRMLMSFLNYAYWTATLSRERMLQAGVEPVPHHKLYDEPQTYMTATPIFELSISKSRKYRVSDNFFIQNPSQVIKRDPELWRQIIGMLPHILVGGGLDNDGLKEMAQILNVSKEELKKLEFLEFHWYFKTYVGKEAVKPFIFTAADLMPPSFGPATELVTLWRERLAPKTVGEHQLDISARNLKLSVSEYLSLLDSFDDQDDEEGVPLGKD